MLKEIELINWKSFAGSKLNIDPLTIVIGANASGKSNTLDALLFLQRVASGVGIFQAINGDVNLTPIRGGIEWICHKPAKIFSLNIRLSTDSDSQDYCYRLEVQVNGIKAEVMHEELILLKYGARSSVAKVTRLFYTLQPENFAPGIQAYFSTGSQGRGKRVDVNRSHIILLQADTLTLRKEVMDGVKQVLAQLQNIFVFDPVPSHMRDYTPFSEKLQADGSNIAGVLAALEEPRKTQVENHLTTYLRNLPERDIQRVWTEPVGKFQTDAMLYCEETWSANASHIVDARGMSDGTLRYLAIVAAMLTRVTGSLLVVEEVDNGLHPSRAHELIDMLRSLGKSRKIDVIVTTHNPALLDAAGAGMVPFITVAHRDPATGSSVLMLLEDIQQLPKLMASGSLGQLSASGRIEAALRNECRFMRKVLILDTSILCICLDVPGKTECGPERDKWDKARVTEKIHVEEQQSSIFVLPLASIIETGNHIAQASYNRWECGQALADLIKKSANEESPWAAFSEQSLLWSAKNLVKLANALPDYVNQKLSLGDATIKEVADYYAKMGWQVEILTGDEGLKAYQPSIPIEIPRRRQR